MRLPVLLVLAALPLSGRALAQVNVAESERKFDRGVKLWDQLDFKGALAELRGSYELNPQPDILYNVAFAHVRLGEPVQAVAALDKVLEAAARLPPERVEKARQARLEQAGQIGQVLVRTNVDATIAIDGVAIGRTPMSAPVPVARGRHWVQAIADGHAPHVDTLDISGGQTLELPLNLVPMQGTPAQIFIRSEIPGAEVVIDGRVMGHTPIERSLPVTPGPHELVLRRPGYQEVRSALMLAGGASQTVSLTPAELPGGGQTGLVGFTVSEPDATVEIDGRPRPDYRQGLRLPVGVHRLTVTRTGFFPVHRDIVSESAVINTVRVNLEPTEETRVARSARATSQRRWAWATVATGALLGGASAVLFFTNRSELRGAEAEYEEVKPMLAPGGQCSSMFAITERCVNLVMHANDRLDRAERMRQLSLIGMGVGGAVLVTGVVLRLLSDDPHRYDYQAPAPDRERGLRFLAGVQPGGALVGLRGNF